MPLACSVVGRILEGGTDTRIKMAFACLNPPPLRTPYGTCPQSGLPAADLVVYLDLDPELSAARGGFGGERYEKLEFQKKARWRIAVLQWSERVASGCGAD